MPIGEVPGPVTKKAKRPDKIPNMIFPLKNIGTVPYHWIMKTLQNNVPLVKKAKIMSPWLKVPPKKDVPKSLIKTA